MKVSEHHHRSGGRTKSAATERRHAALMRLLEPRIMFDAAAVATAVDANPEQPPHENAVADSSGADSIRAVDTAAPAPAPPAANADTVVFVDNSVADYESLIAQLPSNTEVVVLQAGQDGLAQMADYLEGRTGIETLHVLSHGDTGRIQLGGEWIESSDVAANADLLATIGDSLTEQGDILLYGCRVGADGAGMDFIQSLATATGADVAASTDPTGAAEKGGDWILEQATGPIESGLFTSMDALSRYNHLLAAPADENYDDDSGQSFSSTTFTLDGIKYTITGTESSYTNLVWNNSAASLLGNNAGDYYLFFDLSGAFGISSIKVEAADGSAFRLSGISFDSAADVNITLTPNGGSALSYASNGALILRENVNLSANTDFQNITSFTFAGGNISLALDDLNFEPAVSSNATPVITNINGDSVAWAGVGNTVALDAGANASLTDAELGALNSGNGNWSGGSLTAQRSGTAISADTFGFDASGLFTVSGTSASGNLQSGGQTFATYTNSGGLLTVNFTSSGTSATTALVNDVARHINYRNNTPSGDATVRFTLSDGSTSTTANVTVTSDTIFVTNTTDTATIDITNGVSFSEAVGIAAADVSGNQTIAFASTIASTALSINSVSVNESLTFDMDAASGMSLTSGTITLGAATTQTFTHGTSDTATISGVIAGGGALTKTGAGTLTLSGTNTYSGATTISAGTLTVSGGDAISSNSSVSIASGATLSLSSNESIGNLSGAGLINLGSSTLTTTQTADTTFSGDISGTGGLTANQSPAATFALTLSGNNTYTGSTRAINYGWLKLNGDAAVSSSSALVANANSLITLLSDQTVGSLASNNANASIQLGGFTLTAGGNNTSTTVSGVISGTGNLVKQGSGSLTLDGANTFTGTTTVSAGDLSLNNGAAIHDSSAVTVSSGASLTLSASETIGSLTGAGLVTLGANTLTAGGNNTSTTFSGGISGTGGVTKNGSGTWTLSGTNSYTGSTTLSAGGLTLTGGTSIADTSAVTVSGGATLTLNGGNETIGSLAGSGNVALSYRLTAGGDNSSTTFSGVISSSNTSGITKTGSGTLTLSGSNTYSGSTSVSAGTLSIASDSNLGTGSVTLNGGTLSVTGATTIDNDITLGADSTINAGTDFTVSGSISGGSNLTKTGAARLTLAGSNSYTGSTTVNAGILSIASDANLGSGALTLAAGTTLAVTGATTIDNAIALSGAATVNNSADITLSGVVSGANNLTKSGASTLTLAGSNAYSGTTVSAGTLRVASDGNLGSGGLTLAAGTTLDITGATTIDNAIALSGGAATVNAGADATLSGNITGAGGLTKTGASTLILTGLDSFTGATLLNAGRLLVSGALSGTSSATVASGATLGGSGSISGNTTINSGGTLSPGNSAGTLTLNGNLIMNSGSTLAIEINGATAGTQYDRVIVNGTVDVTGATLSATHSYTAGSGDTYTIIVNDAADAVTGTFSGLSEGSTLTAGGNSTTLTASYIGGSGNDITLTAPVAPAVTSVSSSTSNGTYRIGDTIAVTVTFDASVTVTGTPTLQLETGSVDRTLNYVSGSGSNTLTFNYTIQAGDVSADLDYASTSALALNGGTIRNALSNDAILTLPTPGAANSLGANKNLVVDGIRPTASIVVADTALSAGETSVVTVTFNEAVTGLTTSDFTVANGVLTSLSSSDGGITWTATLTPTTSINDTTNVITLDNTGVQDAAGNAGTGTTDSNNYAIDTVRPTASIVVADTALAAGETSTVTITFNEAVTGLTTSDFTVANGALSSLSSSDGGITWTATLTPTTSIEDTTNLITLANSGVQDAAGNAGSGTTDSNNYAIDTLRPTASIVVADTALAAGETSTVTITFNEAVSGLTTDDFTVAHGALSGLSSSDGGITWTATLTPTTSIEDATNLITLANNGVQDAAGNVGTGTTNSNNYVIDTARPTATIVVADSALAVGETSLVTITFSEAVTGFMNADLTIANGTLSSVSSADGGITWTATLTPTASIEDTTNVITLSSTGVADAAGNAGTGTTDSNSYSVDTLRPTATIVLADTVLGVGETSLVTITFSEAVTGFANDDLTVANGSLSSVSSSDGGITWTATLTPATSITDATNLITLATTGVQDAAGNSGAGTTDSSNYTVDTLRPSATVVVADTALTAGETSLVTITMSEAVANFDNADLSAANGTLSTAVTSDGGITWTATLTPDVDITDTTNLVTFDSTGVIDGAGNVGAGSIDSNNYAIDTARPTAVIVVADSALSAGETSLVTITFSEAVTGFTNADLSIDNGVLSAMSSSDGGITWTATLTPTTDTADANNLITLDNAGMQDAAGNAGTGATHSNNYALDSLLPTATVVVADTALAAGETSVVTITFSEAVTGLTNANLTIANGTLSTLSSSDGGITWTATFTPATDLTDTANVITLNNAGVSDTAGNAATGTIESNNYTIDTAIPVVTSVTAPDNGTYVAGQNLDFTVNFSEAVVVSTETGAPRIAITLDSGGTLYASYLSGSGGTALVFRATVITGQLDLTSISIGAVLALNGGSIRDAQTNNAAVALNNVADTSGVLVDAVVPIGALAQIGPANSVSDTLVFELTTSEDVSGLGVEDFTLIKTGSVTAAVSGVQVINAHTYQVTINNIQGAGTLTVQLVAAGSGIADAAGNGLASNVTSITRDVSTVPYVTADADAQLPLPPATTTASPPASSQNTAVGLLGTSTIEGVLANVSFGDRSPGVSTNPLSESNRTEAAQGERGANFTVSASAPYVSASSGRGATLLALPDLGVKNLHSDQSFNVDLPRNTFSVASADATQIAVTVRLVNGESLPSWLKFDAASGTFSGRAPAGWAGRLDILIVARDSKGNRATSVIHFEVKAAPPVARAALDTQFKNARSGGAYRLTACG